MRKLNKLIALLLMLQSLVSLFQSIKFVLFEQHQINLANGGNFQQILNREIVTLVSALLSFFFAIQLSLLPEHKSLLWRNMVGVCLIIFNAIMMNCLTSLPILERFLLLLGL